MLKLGLVAYWQVLGLAISINSRSIEDLSNLFMPLSFSLSPQAMFLRQLLRRL